MDEDPGRQQVLATNRADEMDEGVAWWWGSMGLPDGLYIIPIQEDGVTERDAASQEFWFTSWMWSISFGIALIVLVLGLSEGLG